MSHLTPTVLLMDAHEAAHPENGPAGPHGPLQPTACAVCGRVLSHIFGSGWVHGPAPKFTAEGADHPAVPVPADQIHVRGRCDLCGGEPVVAVAHAAPITIAGVTHNDEMTPLAGYDSDWGCCAVCARLVKKNQWDRLLKRCVNAIAASDDTPITADLVEVLRTFQRALRANLQGPPVPLPHRPPRT